MLQPDNNTDQYNCHGVVTIIISHIDHIHLLWCNVGHEAII